MTSLQRTEPAEIAVTQPPQLLAALIDRHSISGHAPQKPVLWPRQRWLRWSPEYEDVVRRLPTESDRATVRGQVRRSGVTVS
jgi:hypothetical protein